MSLAQDARLKALPSTSRLVLVGMAMSALDTATKQNEAGVYFRGWEYLAVSWLGYEAGLSATAKQAVARATRDLASRDLITAEGRHNGPHSGMTYRLNLLDL